MYDTCSMMCEYDVGMSLFVRGCHVGVIIQRRLPWVQNLLAHWYMQPSLYYLDHKCLTRDLRSKCGIWLPWVQFGPLVNTALTVLSRSFINYIRLPNSSSIKDARAYF